MRRSCPTDTYATVIKLDLFHCMAETNIRTSTGFWSKEFPSGKTDWYENISGDLAHADKGVRKERYFTEGGIMDRTLRFKR